MKPDHEFQRALPSPLASAAQLIAHARLDDAAIERVRLAARRLSECVPPGPASRRRFVPRPIAAVAGGALAAAALLAALFVLLGDRDAWAQVTQNLKSKPWVRWTLQIPETAPDGQPIPEEFRKNPPQIWLSLPKKVAATGFRGMAHFVDFGRKEVFRYEPREKTVYRESASDRDEVQYEHFTTLLRLVMTDDPQTKLPPSPLELIDRSVKDVQEGDRRWTEFRFEFRDTRQNGATHTTTVRIDPATRLPIEMTSDESLGGKKASRTFVFDYPETGPEDVYALGVPREATVLDWRRPAGVKELYAAHAKGRDRAIEPYTAIVVTSVMHSDFADIFDAMRVRFDGSSWQIEHADFDQLCKFRQHVHSKQITIPADADRAAWWKEQVANLPFGPAQGAGAASGHAALADRVGYYMFGDPTAPGGHFTIDQHPAIGPKDAILMSIRTSVGLNNFWMDPQRDYVVRRFETLTGDQIWKYRTTILDKLEKSPGGKWYATQVRVGDVQDSGDEPPEERDLAPVTTSIYRLFVEFD